MIKVTSVFVFRSDLPNFRDVGLPFFFRPRPGCHSVSHPGWVGVGSAHLPLEKRQRRLLPLRRPGLVANSIIFLFGKNY